MKCQELKQALQLVTKVLTDSRVESGQGDKLRKAKRELEAVARSGKLDGDRIFRATELIATVLMELVEKEATPTAKVK